MEKLLALALLAGVGFMAYYNRDKIVQNKTYIDYAFEKGANMVKAREGLRLVVYADSLGNPTVGWGHLVRASDNLKLGDKITREKANEFFNADYQIAFHAALNQAQDLGKPRNIDFIAALASVNFQLGTNWPNIFYTTYPLLRSGDWQNAINNLLSSKWNSQTPVRVADFVNAIRGAYA